jgi:hypothetical protein
MISRKIRVFVLPGLANVPEDDLDTKAQRSGHGRQNDASEPSGAQQEGEPTGQIPWRMQNGIVQRTQMQGLTDKVRGGCKTVLLSEYKCRV